MNALKALDKQINNLVKYGKRNAPTIMTVLGVTGFITTTVMACKATPAVVETFKKIDEETPEDTPKSKVIFKKIKAAAPIYGPSALMGLTSGFMIFKANDISSDRLAGALTACEIKDNFIKEYQGKVIETIGERKEAAIRDEIAKDRVEKNPYDEDKVIQASTGTTLFMDSITGVYFRSTKDSIYEALMSFKHMLILEDFMTLNEWYYELGIEPNKIGDKIGWNSTDGIDIYWSVQAAPNGEPVTVLEYRTPPSYDFCIKNNW